LRAPLNFCLLTGQLSGAASMAEVIKEKNIECGMLRV
jgi:hypothetical protein